MKAPKFTIVLALAGLVSAAAAKPNILFIVVDDLGYGDLSMMNLSADVKTPNIDSLASTGVFFSDAYATAPICNASRISLMTGRYQQRQGTYWYAGKGLHNPDIPTLAEVLKEAGYATGYVGKFHHGSEDKPNGRGYPLNHGFDYFYGFSGGTKHFLHHKAAYTGKNDKIYQGPMYVGREKQDVEGFSTELFGEQARHFIEENKDQPFYLHLSFNAVHNFTHQLPSEYLEKMGLKGFADHDPAKEGYWEWRKKIGYPNHPEGRAYYLGQLHYLDRELGRVFETLETLGLRDNTVIVFVSDNGGSLVTYANNGPLKGGKYTLFEGGTRVPILISYPDAVGATVVSQSVVSTMDLLPTICSLTKTAMPSGLDGIDLSPVLKGNEGLSNSRTLFWDTKAERSVRRGHWKLLITEKTPNERLQIADTPKGVFLYNLKDDIGETTDLSSNHPELVTELKRALAEWQAGVKIRQTEPNTHAN